MPQVNVANLTSDEEEPDACDANVQVFRRRVRLIAPPPPAPPADSTITVVIAAAGGGAVVLAAAVGLALFAYSAQGAAAAPMGLAVAGKAGGREKNRGLERVLAPGKGEQRQALLTGV